MKLIPPTITDLASSKKGLTFWVLIGLALGRDQIGLPIEWFACLSFAAGLYFLAQGVADAGRAVAGAWERSRKTPTP